MAQQTGYTETRDCVSVELRTVLARKAFVITFEDSSMISISLKPSDYAGPEALEFIGRDNV
jgi:hypothetical protein